MTAQKTISATLSGKSNEGLGAWLAAWLRTSGWRMERKAAQQASRLAIVERIPLAPRHQLALIEADGQRLLVALNQEGAPAFYPLAAIKQKTAACVAGRRVTQC
ncbi:MAG TPA: flagellar biosynthetic protein FliO [Terracidiphilus sp.]|nr:flagellar biosynthetic protein FliO [Terracidiphilus sp.]